MRSARQPSHSPHRGVRSNDVHDHALSCNLLVAVTRLTLLDLPGERRGDQQPRAGRDRGRRPRVVRALGHLLGRRVPGLQADRTDGAHSGQPVRVLCRHRYDLQCQHRRFSGRRKVLRAGMVRRRRRAVRDPGVPTGGLRYDVLGRGCSWHHDRRPIGAVPLAGMATGVCDTGCPRHRLSLHLLHEGSPCTTSVHGRPPVMALATVPGLQGDLSCHQRSPADPTASCPQGHRTETAT